MSKPMKIAYAGIDDLFLDPTNPRLGRRVASPTLRQSKVLDEMSSWTLDELAISFIENGFWPQEALIVVREVLYGKEQLVVVEGNRRLASLKLLHQAMNGGIAARRWKEMADSGAVSKELFTQIPYIEVANRAQVSAYLGFRHVTGIKEWAPAEKAQYIAKLIEEENLTYDQVRRKIGSKAPTVRQHYIAYRLLLQMDTSEDIYIDKVEDKFSVLYLSLRTPGSQKYLGLDMKAEPRDAIKPVSDDAMPKLVNYARWLFGSEKQAPLFSDSRHVDDFGRILENDEAVIYLERTEEPKFEMAMRKSGASEDQMVERVAAASDLVQQALGDIHVFKNSKTIARSVERLGADVVQLLSIFPAVKGRLLTEWMTENAGDP